MIKINLNFLGLFIFFNIVSLILLLSIWNVFIEPPTKIPRVVPVLFYCLPLAIIIYKMRKNKVSTYVISAYLSLIYFILGVSNLSVNISSIYSWAIVIFSLMIFFTCLIYVRAKNLINS
ncbi:MAG: hypothetical protein CMD90_01245 [Gammaproteobacteria bacterium]|nr:hypothetical protein [Gammaproteobacteria bacterium]